MRSPTLMRRSARLAVHLGGDGQADRSDTYARGGWFCINNVCTQYSVMRRDTRYRRRTFHQCRPRVSVRLVTPAVESPCCLPGMTCRGYGCEWGYLHQLTMPHMGPERGVTTRVFLVTAHAVATRPITVRKPSAAESTRES